MPSVDATRPARPAWRRWTLGATCLAALLALIPGPMLGRMPTTLWSVALAMTAAVFAQFASFRFRQGDRTVLFGWGEAALIIVVYLVPTGWVGPVIGVGSLIGHSLYLLRTNAAWTPTKLMSVTNLAVAGAIGAIAARLVGPAAPAITPRMIVALVAGAAAYTVVGAVLVNAVLVTSAADPFWRAVARTLWDKLPIIAGNVAIGLTVVVLLVVDKRWLLLTPPLVVSMRQLYVYRSRDADERRIWREYADIARALHQLDERGVAIAGAEGAIRLFHAAAVEVWVDRLAGTVRGFRGTPGAGGVDVVPLVGGDGGWRTEPSATRRLSIGGVRVGEIRLWMRAGMMLDGRDQMVFAAVADALAAALHDATAHRALRTLAARTFHDANHDVLTGIANRATLMRDGCELLERLPEHGRLSLTVLDINRFKDVNDTLGHLAGDELLRTTAGRLAAFVRPGELLARIGGDEFAILAPGAPTPATDVEPVAPAAHTETAADSEPVDRARELVVELGVPTEIAGMRLPVEVSVGVAVIRRGECDLTELLRRAESAMYRAKWGAGPVAVFDPASRPADTSGVERLSILVDMREALGRTDQLDLAVQPALDLRTGLPIGSEVLVRWRHPHRGLVAPDEFITLVDHSDLVAPFTRYVLNSALRLAREWRRGGVAQAVSVNLSPRSLADPSLPTDVATMLTRYGVDPCMLILEITESAVVSGQVADVLGALRAQGVQLAVDDFGTGHSSLSFLTRVQVDEVKVDASFVGQMVDSPEAAAIVRTTVDLGRRLGVRVVAEGVETAAQRHALTELGCGAAQGWHIVAPVAASESLDLLRALSRGASMN